MPDRHALLSPSAAERWLNCPRSVRLTENLPETTSEYAEAGRLAHEIAELRLRKQFLEPMSQKQFNAQLNKLKKKPHYAAEMLSATEEYLDFVNEVFLGFPIKPYIAVEQEVDLSEYAPDSFGTADCIMIGGNILHVVDYKNGQGVPVSAVENPQMKLYALGALSRYRLTYDVIDAVRMSIVQPNTSGGAAETWETSAEELARWGAEYVRPRAQLAFDGEGELCSGDWCRFCKNKGACTARSSALALEAFGKRPPATYSDAEIGDILKRAKELAAWCKDLEEYALSAALAGRRIPGFKAVAGRSNRQFDDQEAAFRAIISAGTAEALLYERTPLTLAAVEKLLGKKTFAAVAGSHVISPPGKPTLVADTDKRPAINLAQRAFGVQEARGKR